MPVVFLNNDNLVEMLKQKQIYVWGAGEKARDLKKCFTNKGLKIKSFCVDDEYYREGKSNIIRLSDVPDEDHVALIYDMASVSTFRKRLEWSTHSTMYVYWDNL